MKPISTLYNKTVSQLNLLKKPSTVDNGTVLDYFMTFDIETTSMRDSDGEPVAWMYIWQACIDKMVFYGSRWEEFQDFLQRVAKIVNGYRLIVYVHNLSFEFQFIRNFVNITKVFATEPRKVIRMEVAPCFIFKCSYRLTNMSLKKFLESRPEVPQEYKKGEDFDYRKIRVPNTVLTNKELEYCRNDVLGLYIAIEALIKDNGYTLSTVPLTSTGFIRNEARERMRAKKKNGYLINKIAPTVRDYTLCKEALRGGNSHCNPVFAGDIVTQVYSRDMSSAYPAIMIQCKFPMTKFRYIANFMPDDFNNDYAYLLRVEFWDLELNTMSTMPYLSLSKALKIAGQKVDNGRIVAAKYIAITITDIDWKIINEQYHYSDVNINLALSAYYDYLPDEYRDYIFSLYKQKCELKGGDKYQYNKFKNKINATFGMMLTDIANPEIIYDPYSEKPFIKQAPDLELAIDISRRSRSTFLAYQWGVWVTAHCRNRLQRAIQSTVDNPLTEPIYCDTDSLKVMGDLYQIDKIFDKLNEDIKAETEACGINTHYTSRSGREFDLGLWEKDGWYKKFRSLGAKKYYVIENNGHHEITVAGLSKEKGTKYLKNKLDGINSFIPGTTIPEEYSGRTTSSYIDVDRPYEISMNGCTFTTGSAIHIEEATYTLGITGDYFNLLQEIRDTYEKPIN